LIGFTTTAALTIDMNVLAIASPLQIKNLRDLLL